MDGKAKMIIKIGMGALTFAATIGMAIVEFKSPDQFIDKLVSAVKSAAKSS